MDQDDNGYFGMYKFSNICKERTKASNLNFSITGEFYSYTTDDSLKIYSTKNKDLKNIITVEIGTMKYFQEKTILHSKGRKINYLSIHDNKTLARFDNVENVNSISVSSLEDVFMTVGSSNTNIWDIRCKNPITTIKSNGKIGALSSENTFALADNNFAYLFDRRNDKGPVVTKNIPPNFYKNISFSFDGNFLTLSGKRDIVFLNRNLEFYSRICTEKSWSGEIQDDSNTFVYATANSIYAHRILSNERIGQIAVPLVENCYSLKTSPCDMSFIFLTSNNNLFIAERLL